MMRGLGDMALSKVEERLASELEAEVEGHFEGAPHV